MDLERRQRKISHVERVMPEWEFRYVCPKRRDIQFYLNNIGMAKWTYQQLAKCR